MPIFEFKCKKCGHFFEELVQNGQKIKCPKCQSPEVAKQFSVFSKSGTDSDSGSSSSACSSCSSSNCGSCAVPAGRQGAA